MLRIVILIWEDYDTKLSFPVGALRFDGKQYAFLYLKGAKQAELECRFEPLINFPRFNNVYCSRELFAFFANRIMRSTRPDYQDYLKKFNLQNQNPDAMDLLAKTGGRRQTDSFRIEPYYLYIYRSNNFFKSEAYALYCS